MALFRFLPVLRVERLWSVGLTQGDLSIVRRRRRSREALACGRVSGVFTSDQWFTDECHRWLWPSRKWRTPDVMRWVNTAVVSGNVAREGLLSPREGWRGGWRLGRRSPCSLEAAVSLLWVRSHRCVTRASCLTSRVCGWSRVNGLLEEGLLKSLSHGWLPLGLRFVFMAASVSSVVALGSFSSDLKKSSECIRGTAGTAQLPECFLKRGSLASPPKRERFVRTYASSSPPPERGWRVHSPCHGLGHGIPDFPWASVEGASGLLLRRSSRSAGWKWDQRRVPCAAPGTEQHQHRAAQCH